ncbi:glycerol kinase [Kwoniella mangroviensis CBS 10435]|uniref:glycerol kinase n=1 Tax=Kwoniella mangroviensis CBS 10435 TaxID=1331196 RepID=A0A1B9IH51_9TREE|nr:glycerol kinase [Kwoniella mangroviensis CBS 10435]OCF72920.1 glycerol kinase [Kwoniella mangroviensis CBS 8886]
MSRQPNVDLQMSSMKHPSPLGGGFGSSGGPGSFTPVFETSPQVSPANSRRPSISAAAGSIQTPVPRRLSEVASGRPSFSQQAPPPMSHQVSYFSGGGGPPPTTGGSVVQGGGGGYSGGASLSRRASTASHMSSGPRPIQRADYSGPNTPSLLSRAGSPTLPLGNEHTTAPRAYFEGSGGFSGLDGNRELRQGQFIGSLDCGTTSTRFIIFDKRAKIIAEHQTEFEQILPHAGWHEHDPEALVDAMTECINKAVEKLEWMGWSRKSIKGIGITNQRETTVCWSRTTGKPLCNAIVWDDSRTLGVVREYEKKLEEEGLDIDDEEEDLKGVPEDVEIGTGGEDAAFGEKGDVVVENEDEQVKSDGDGLAEKVGAKLENLGLAHKGKEAKQGQANGNADVHVHKKRKGKEGIVDVTGIPLSTYFSAIKLRWMLDHQKQVNEAHENDDLMFGTVDTWLVYALTGREQGGLHIMDVTNASRTLLISLKTLQWHPPLLRFFGIRPSVLPKIVSSSEIYGTISESIGTPLTSVPIAGIVGDQQAALVGNKCLRKGEAKCTYGTGAFVLFNTGEECVRSNYGLISTVAFQAGPDAKPVYALEGSIAVAGSAIKWLRDQMNLIEESSDMDILAGSVADTGGVYFVTAFSGLLAPYWDREASGTIIGLTSYTTSAHIARATLEAVCFQTRAVLDVIEKESQTTLETLKVDGGVTNSDLAMQLQANIGGFNVARPAMRESTALGSALLAANALKLFGWDLSRPETLADVNTAGVHVFESELEEKDRKRAIKGWERAVSRASKWHEEGDEEEEEERYEEQRGLSRLPSRQH